MAISWVQSAPVEGTDSFFTGVITDGAHCTVGWLFLNGEFKTGDFL